MQIEEIQEEIVSEFSMFDDWMQRYEYMIELGKTLPRIAEEFKTDDHLIKGCQSKVWVHADLEDGKVLFTADRDPDPGLQQPEACGHPGCRNRFYR